MNWHNALAASLFIVLSFVAGVGVFIIGKKLKHSSAEDLHDLLQKHPIHHLGIIMDGNRRWAKDRGFKPWIGHQQGLKNLRIAVKFCHEYNIPYLTVYAFSLENFKRSTEELNFLFKDVLEEVASKDADELAQKGVRVCFAGDRTKFPQSTVSIIEDMEQKTAHNSLLVLTILFCYGGQQEIVAASQELCREVLARNGSPDSITAEMFERHLWTRDLPPVDLVIRTGYVSRLSNFLLYKVAYSELYFVDCYWPDMTEDRLIKVIKNFVTEQHRLFGA